MTDFSTKALGVWTDIADELADEFTSQQVRACVAAITAALEEAVMAEREACAKIADSYHRGALGNKPNFARASFAQYIRDDIRARNRKEP
jgi:hypothetical protein